MDSSVSKKLSMSLDDIIKQNKSETKGKPARKQFSKPRGNERRFNKKPLRNDRRDDRRRSFKSFNRSFNKPRNERNDRFDRNERKEISFSRKKCKLRIENLHYNIGNDELKVHDFQIFSKKGTIYINWDNLGRSKVMPNEISYIFKGTAVVEYENEEDAERAVKEFNEAELDGQILKVTYFQDDSVPKIQRKPNFKKRY